jgi:hypothetical protein
MGTDLTGVVSIIDGKSYFLNKSISRLKFSLDTVLAFFAEVAGLPDVDPKKMQKTHRIAPASPRIGADKSSPRIQTLAPVLAT